MDSKTLVEMEGNGKIPSVLRNNWKVRHWCDPVDAARKVLLLEKYSRRLDWLCIIGVGVFVGMMAVFVIALSLLRPIGPMETGIIFSPLALAAVWLFAYLSVKAIGSAPGLDTVDKEFREEVLWFGNHLSDFQKATGKPYLQLASMDLKVLAEELLVDRAKQVRLVEEEIKNLGGLGTLSDNHLYHRRINCKDALSSLHTTLGALGLVVGGYDRYYNLAQKALEEERPVAHEIGPKQK